ncbi:MAG: NUDIX domain-containing protein [Candidatus Dependentiae bacterium]
MIRQFSAGLVLYYDCDGKPENREFLLLHYATGHWDFAKGKIEKGETKHQAALRELDEETGLTADVFPGFEEQFSYWFRDQDGQLINKTVYFFVACTNQKDVALSHEHIGFDWLPYEAALERLTYKNAQDMLRKVKMFLEE